MYIPTFKIRVGCASSMLILVLSGCVNPKSSTDEPVLAAGQTERVLTLEAEYFRKDGKTGIRLVRSSGNKELDEATLKLLVDITDRYPDLKEGETMPVKFPDMNFTVNPETSQTNSERKK